MITKLILAVSSVVLVLLLYRLAWKHEEKATTSGQLMGLTGRKWTKKFGISFFLLEYKDLIQLKKNLFEKDLPEARVSGIRFYVHRGTVSLYGAMQEGLEREVVLSLVKGIPGVVGVSEHFDKHAPF
jgi:hypothetical protein